MITATCNFCDWQLKTTGVWKARRESRNHLQEKHPEQYAAMVADEIKIAKQHGELSVKYGQAMATYL